MRIGHGYDVHAFKDATGDGDHVMLGGVQVPHDRGVKAHSDGDVVLHALCDALFGAAALGDIGQHFPDTDPSLSGIDSKELLHQTVTKLQQLDYRLVNADITIVAQQPRVNDYKDAMRSTIAAVFDCGVGQINVKATTTEKLGYLGRSEGLAAHAVVLIESSH
ncbi:MAG: 2-C-methyl-D-erythritol 2,4-cyclodiphosphate synthase [Pseudomonadales bacterium]